MPIMTAIAITPVVFSDSDLPAVGTVLPIAVHFCGHMYVSHIIFQVISLYTMAMVKAAVVQIH
jgi:hypothetical protein